MFVRDNASTRKIIYRENILFYSLFSLHFFISLQEIKSSILSAR